jgi:hypothetical protein
MIPALNRVYKTLVPLRCVLHALALAPDCRNSRTLRSRQRGRPG